MEVSVVIEILELQLGDEKDIAPNLPYEDPILLINALGF